MKSIAVIVGSLRKDSLNRKIAKALMSMAPATLSMEFTEIGDLPFYNEDLDGTPPVQWTAVRKDLGSRDGILLVSPEYNRSVPAPLKNVIDIGSRPYGQNLWSRRPGAVVTASPGAVGGFGANHHIRQALVGVGMLTMVQPEMYLGSAGSYFDDAGKLTNPKTIEVFKRFLVAFEQWVLAHPIAG